MKIIEKIESKEDIVTKYILQDEEGLISEHSYIDNGTGKDIICVSCATSCNLGCKFCFLTDFQDKVKMKYLDDSEIFQAAKLIDEDQNLTQKDRPIRSLLVSFMGCGEPMLNSWSIY